MSDVRRLPTAVPDDGALVLNLATMVTHTEAEGPGERFAIWVQGCHVRCSGCCNPHYFSDAPNKLRTVDEVFAAVLKAKKRYPGIEGVSFLGGEPTEQSPPLAALARKCHEAGLTVMLFTGRIIEDLRAEGNVLLPHVDLVLDGPYVEELRTTKIRWAGSTNQRFLFLTDAYAPGDPRFLQPNVTEIKMVDGEIVVVGFPFENVVKAFSRRAGEGTITPDPKPPAPNPGDEDRDEARASASAQPALFVKTCCRPRIESTAALRRDRRDRKKTFTSEECQSISVVGNEFTLRRVAGTDRIIRLTESDASESGGMFVDDMDRVVDEISVVSSSDVGLVRLAIPADSLTARSLLIEFDPHVVSVRADMSIDVVGAKNFGLDWDFGPVGKAGGFEIFPAGPSPNPGDEDRDEARASSRPSPKKKRDRKPPKEWVRAFHEADPDDLVSFCETMSRGGVELTLRQAEAIEKEHDRKVSCRCGWSGEYGLALAVGGCPNASTDESDAAAHDLKANPGDEDRDEARASSSGEVRTSHRAMIDPKVGSTATVTVAPNDLYWIEAEVMGGDRQRGEGPYVEANLYYMPKGLGKALCVASGAMEIVDHPPEVSFELRHEQRVFELLIRIRPAVRRQRNPGDEDRDEARAGSSSSLGPRTPKADAAHAGYVSELDELRAELDDAGGRGVELADRVDACDAAVTILEGGSVTCRGCGDQEIAVEPLTWDVRLRLAAAAAAQELACRDCDEDFDDMVKRIDRAMQNPGDEDRDEARAGASAGIEVVRGELCFRRGEGEVTVSLGGGFSVVGRLCQGEPDEENDPDQQDDPPLFVMCVLEYDGQEVWSELSEEVEFPLEPDPVKFLFEHAGRTFDVTFVSDDGRSNPGDEDRDEARASATPRPDEPPPLVLRTVNDEEVVGEEAKKILSDLQRELAAAKADGSLGDYGGEDGSDEEGDFVLNWLREHSPVEVDDTVYTAMLDFIADESAENPGDEDRDEARASAGKPEEKPEEKLEGKIYVRVEWDPEYWGGDYGDAGDGCFVDVTDDPSDDEVLARFEAETKADRRNVIHWSPDDIYVKVGKRFVLEDDVDADDLGPDELDARAENPGDEDRDEARASSEPAPVVIQPKDIKTFGREYVKHALMAASELDDEVAEAQFPKATRDLMLAEAERFARENAADLEAGHSKKRGRYSSAARCFWQSRNALAGGFFDDGDWSGPAVERLADAASKFPAVMLVVGDDGKIEQVEE